MFPSSCRQKSKYLFLTHLLIYCLFGRFCLFPCFIITPQIMFEGLYRCEFVCPLICPFSITGVNMFKRVIKRLINFTKWFQNQAPILESPSILNPLFSHPDTSCWWTQRACMCTRMTGGWCARRATPGSVPTSSTPRRSPSVTTLWPSGTRPMRKVLAVSAVLLKKY